MAHHVDACYDEDEHTFLPPFRTLGFNPQLKINDSLLALSYVEAYDISYPEAIQRIEDEVTELKMHIETEGAYDLYDIGQLALNEEGNYIFTPCESGILTPSLYGLDAFDMMPMLPAVVTAPTTANIKVETATSVPVGNVSDINEREEDYDDDTVRIKFSWIRNTVAIAAILLAIFLLALPTGKTEMMTRTISNINNSLLFGMMSKDTNISEIKIKKETRTISNINNSLLFGMMSKDTNISEIKIKKEDTSPKTTSVDTILKRDTAKVVQSDQNGSIKTGYCIVLASHVGKQNAEMFVEILKKKGLDSAEVYMHNNVRRVICGNFQTQSEAYQALYQINKNKGLEEAWVYKFN